MTKGLTNISKIFVLLCLWVSIGIKVDVATPESGSASAHLSAYRGLAANSPTAAQHNFVGIHAGAPAAH